METIGGKEYLTVKEYAQAIDVTPQAIYYRLNKDSKFKAKTIKSGNRTMIEKSAVEDAAQIFFCSNFDRDFNKNKQTLIDALQQQIEAQQQQLDGKDREIRELHTEIETLHNEIQALHGLLNQQQQLNLLDKQKIQQLEAATQPGDSRTDEAPGAGRRKRRWRNRE